LEKYFFEAVMLTSELQEIYSIQEVIEVLAIDNLMYILRPEHLEQLRHCCKLIETVGETSDLLSFIEYELQFHRTLVAFGSSRKMQRNFEQLIFQLYFICFNSWWHLNNGGVGVKELIQISPTHQMIVDAVEIRDLQWAQQLLKQQLKSSYISNTTVLQKGNVA
jgi:DNA-binding GntR family transcriptional regulator